MIFHSGNVQGLAKFYRIPSTAVSFSGAGGAPLSVLRSLYQAVRRSNSANIAKGNEAGKLSIMVPAPAQKPS